MRRIRLVDASGKVLDSAIYLDRPQRPLTRTDLEELVEQIEATLPEIDPIFAAELLELLEEGRILVAKDRLTDHLVKRHDSQELWIEYKTLYASHIQDERRFCQFMRVFMDGLSLAVATFLTVWIFM